MGNISPNPLSQRQLYALAKDVLDILSDPTAPNIDPIRYARAELALQTAFEQTPRDSVFSPYMHHQLGKKKFALLKARYEQWERQTRLEVTG